MLLLDLRSGTVFLFILNFFFKQCQNNAEIRCFWTAFNGFSIDKDHYLYQGLVFPLIRLCVGIYFHVKNSICKVILLDLLILTKLEQSTPEN